MEVLNNICIDIVDCEHKTAPIQNEGIPSIRTTDIKNGFLDFKGSNKVSEETYQKWTQRLEPKAYDIILAREAPVGQVGILPKGQRVCLGQRTVLIRPNKQKVYPFYLLYLLLSREIQHKMKVRASGSTVEHLNMSDIRNLQLPDLPSLKIQKEIGDTLGNLDAKIENLRRQNETLEAIAQTLFKHWFIDFEFPNADGKPYKSSGGAMVRSELGEIPEGWRVGKLGDIGKIITGKTPSTQSPELWGNDLPFITPTDFKHYRKYILGAERKISQLASSQFKTYIIPQNSIVVTCIGSDMGKVAKTAISCITNQQINSIILFQDFYFHEYIFNYLKNQYKLLRNIALGGSTMPIINKSAFSDIEIIVPSLETLNFFENLAQPLNKKIINNEKQLQTLTKTRDTLLPKLMSGQIRVKE